MPADPQPKIAAPIKRQKVCSVPGCGGGHWARGLCMPHYQKMRSKERRDEQKAAKCGLLHTLTQEQQAAILAYDGPERHGDAAFLIAATKEAWTKAEAAVAGRVPKFGYRPVLKDSTDD